MYDGDKERVETGEHGNKMQRHCKTDICELFMYNVAVPRQDSMNPVRVLSGHCNIFVGYP